jgi:hypothetical protein
MKYRLTVGDMLIDGIAYDKGDLVELDDKRAKAWAARLEPEDTPEPEFERAKTIPREGDDEPPAPRTRTRRAK